MLKSDLEKMMDWLLMHWCSFYKAKNLKNVFVVCILVRNNIKDDIVFTVKEDCIFGVRQTASF